MKEINLKYLNNYLGKKVLLKDGDKELICSVTISMGPIYFLISGNTYAGSVYKDKLNVPGKLYEIK